MRLGTVIGRAGAALAASIFVWLALAAVLAGRGLTDVYDIEAGLALLDSDSLLAVGQPVAAALIGVALVFVVAATRDLAADTTGVSYAMRCSSGFGTMGATLMVLAGLVGGFGRFEIRYLGGVYPAETVEPAYLPLMLFTNRAFAAAIAATGLWLLLSNLDLARRRLLPAGVSTLGVVAGALAASGFLIPGGGLGLLGLLLTMVWVGALAVTSTRPASRPG